MRILHTAGTYTPSRDGVAEVVRQISERVAALGHEVHVATVKSGGQKPEETLNGVQVHRFAAGGDKASGFNGNIEGYCRFVRDGGWDLMVDHCAQIWCTDAVVDEIGKFRWPSLLVTHGLSGFGKTAFDPYFRELAYHIGGYARWISISRDTEESEFASAFRLVPPVFINNGVDPVEWAAPTLCLREQWRIGEKPWIVNVSNHNPFKGHAKFFSLARKLAPLGARFTIVGGNYGMRRFGLGRFGLKGGCYYTCFIKEKLFRTIDLAVNIPRNEVVSALKEADVLVSTSNWEANSVVILEAMAAGTPWVSFDVGSARHNCGGLIAGNSEELEAKVSLLIKDPGLRASLANEGIARIRDQHCWDDIVSRYYSLYVTVRSEYMGKMSV